MNKEEEVENQSIEGVGRLFKSTREKRDISLKKIAQQTKIGLTLLKHLENEELEKLPNKTYVKGFVKSYAKALGIDEEEALAKFQETYKDFNPGQKKVDVISKKEETKNAQNIRPKEIKKEYLIAGIVIFVIAGSLAIFPLLSNKKEKIEPAVVKKVIETKRSRPTVASSQKNLFNNISSQYQKQNEINLVEKPKKELVAAPTPEAKKVIEKKQEKKKEAEKTDDKKVFKQITGPLFSTSSNIPKEVEPHISWALKEASQPGMENVFITAYKDDTWITYKKDDGPIRRFTLSKGKSIIIRGKSIRLFTGNMNNLGIVYNGQFVVAKSRSGVKSFIFPATNPKKFVLPLFIYNYKKQPVITSEEYLKLEKI